MSGNERYGRNFGDGKVGGREKLSIMASDMERALAVGWSQACPNTKKVIQEYGEKWTLARYIECNAVYEREILSRALKCNPSLYRELVSPVARLPEEFLDSEIDRSLVPYSFETEMSPLSTPTGYAIPRLVLAYCKGDRIKVTETRRILEIIIPMVKEPIGLALRLGQELATVGANKEKLIYHLMSADKLKEEGCKSIYWEILSRMPEEAPLLFAEYKEMQSDLNKMRGDGIIQPTDLE